MSIDLLAPIPFMAGDPPGSHTSIAPRPLENERQVRALLERYKALPLQAQEGQLCELESVFYDLLRRGKVPLILVLFDELPEFVVCQLLDGERARSFLFDMYQEKSLWSRFLQNAFESKRQALIQTLLSLFLERQKNGSASGKDASAAAGLLLSSPYSFHAVDFVLALPEKLFEEVMETLDDKKALTGEGEEVRPYMSRFFEKGFERVFRWASKQKEGLVSYLKLHALELALLEAIRTCFQERLAKSDFSFLFSLLNALSSEAQKKLIASIPHWNAFLSETNFLHWLYARQEPQARDCLEALFEALPFEELAKLMCAIDGSGNHPAQIAPERHRTLMPSLSERLAKEWHKVCVRGVMLSEILPFLCCIVQKFFGISPIEFLDDVAQSKDPACQDSVRYCNELVQGWGLVEQYEKDDDLQDGVGIGFFTLFELAFTCASGPSRLSWAFTLRSVIEARLRGQILRSSSKYEEARKNFFSFKEVLRKVTSAALETSLRALSSRNVTRADVEPFFQRKLSCEHLSTLLPLMESSRDNELLRLVPEWKKRLAFWRNFSDFIAARKKEGIVTIEHVSEVIKQMHGMSLRVLERSGIDFGSFLEVMEKSGDEKTHALLERYRTIFRALSSSPTFEIEVPRVSQILCEAYFIEITLPRMNLVEERVLRRPDTHLVHALQYNPKTRRVWLLARLSWMKKFSRGSYKIVTPAIELQEEDHTYAVAKIRLLMNRSKYATTAGYEKEIRHIHCVEAEILRHFRGNPGVNACLAQAEYTYARFNPHSSKTEDRAAASFIVEPARPLILSSSGPFAFRDQVNIMYHVCSTLDALHKEGVIHGDLKDTNVMVEGNHTSALGKRAVLIDFGFSEPCEVGKPISPIGNTYYDRGIYGTIIMTPPELLGVRGFSGDHFKVEAFATGHLMYRLMAGHYPAWGNISQDYYDQGYLEGTEQVQAQGRLYKALKKWVNQLREPIAQKLQQNQKLLPAEQFRRVLCGLLEPDPWARWTVGQAMEALGNILTETKSPDASRTMLVSLA